MILVKTFLDTKLAVGRFGWILGYGRVRPTGWSAQYEMIKRENLLATAIGMITNRSIYRNLSVNYAPASERGHTGNHQD
jgi:hypothetical protein